MSVLIKGMEMPKGNSTINVLIYADGTVYTGHVNDSQYSAVSVPTPHGRLIDAVDHPPHYTYGDIEVIDYIAQTLGAEGFKAYCLGNVIKYISRAEHKNGKEDYKKARWYLDRIIEDL